MAPSRTEKRRLLFAANQEKLTTDELAMQKLQNHASSERFRTAITINGLRSAKRWFTEFMEHQHPGVDVIPMYFTPGAPLPEMSLLKEYARYLVRSRVGGLNEKLSVKTVNHYMAMIISIIERECKHEPQTLLRRELHNFVTNDLVVQEGIRTAMHVKGVAHTEDVTFILSKLYSPEYLNRFPDMRTVLNLTLYIVLVVDLCGRGAEIARNPSRPVHQCLHWEDVEFYTFQRIDDNVFDIRANIKVRWSKGQTADESRYRTVPFSSLLPPSMALEDTLRLLLTLALMDGIFDYDVKTWEDLGSLRLPPHIAKTGRRIAIKQEFRSVPVLRRMNQKHRLTTDPVMTIDMQAHIRKLGQYCGLENRLVAYCFRRGVAYILATQANEENQRFCMGHRPGSKTFFTYKSMISTINFPAMFRMLDNGAVRTQSGITLNRSDEAPIRLSEEGEELILHDKDVQAISDKRDLIRAAILQTHPSLQAASKANDPLYSQFKEASDSRAGLISSLRKKMFQSEYRQHFVELAARPILKSDAAQAQSHEPDDSKIPSPLEDSVSEEKSWVSNESNGAPNDSDTTNTPNTELGTEAESLIDLRLLDDTAWKETLALEEERLDELTSAERGANGTIDPTIELSTDSIEEISNSAAQAETDDPSMALHGAPDRSIGKGVGRVKMKGMSAYNDIVADMKDVEEDEAALCGVMMSWFKVTHGIDTFWAGQEPLTGTYECRFCGIDLAEIHHPDEHCYKCAQKDAIQRATSLRDWIFPLNRPCQYQFCGHGDQLFEFVPCGKTFTTIKEQGEHMRNHVRSMQKNDANGEKVPTCFFGACARNPEGGRIHRDGPDFDSVDDMMDHVWSVHQVYTVKANEVKFCEYCQTWLIEPLEWRSHAERHLNDAHDAVAKHGYTGVTVGRAIVPRICPFCFHDEESPAQKRIATFPSFFDLSAHISLHLEEQEKENIVRRCPCFPAMCTKEAKMNSTELRTHLEVVHGIEAKTKKAPKRKANTNDSSGRRTRAKKS